MASDLAPHRELDPLKYLSKTDPNEALAEDGVWAVVGITVPT